MSQTALTVQVLDEDPAVVAIVGLTLANADVDNGNSFVNTDKTFLVVYADGHDGTVIATLSRNKTAVDTKEFGELDVDAIVVTLAASDSNPQVGYVKIPPGYNTAGKINIAWSSGGGAWVAGEVKVGAVRLV